MPMFYFHLTEDGERSADLEGSSFASFELAYLATHQAIQDMWSEMVRRGKDPRNCSFEITDSTATSLAVVPFAEAMDGRLPSIFRSDELGSDPCPEDDGPDAAADRARQARRNRKGVVAAGSRLPSRNLPFA